MAGLLNIKGIACVCLGISLALSCQSAAFALPDWLEASGEFRARYQSFDNQIRPGLSEDSTVLTLRSLLHLKVKASDRLRFGVELQDSRIYGDRPGAGLSTGIVNSLEMLQAYAELDLEDSFQEGDESTLRFGRITHDQGRRRFMARNRFRNTINAFTGVLYQWRAPSKDTKIEAFWFLPVERQPNTQADLARNKIKFDNESFGQQFWSLFYQNTALPFGLTGDAYIYGLHERDSDHRATRNRQLYTPGFALYHLSKPGEWHFDTEAALNIGTARATSAAADTRDLDQLAYFFHLEGGYHFETAWSPRLLLQLDIASGDSDPNDDKLGRFDTLFGPKRADFGPTDIYGAFARANIIAAGTAIHLTPVPKSNVQFRYLGVWLEDRRDVWSGVGVIDTSGASGRFVGHQLETRAHYDIVPKRVRIGGGSSYLIKGRFAETAPNANAFGDGFYFFADVTLKF